ncbi:hypothetical protein HIM_00762 [Hirsutella minnesotensis 3608]|nr:hypothetical protein HIM_00762 [Hirsutella minnesotensis 3608]
MWQEGNGQYPLPGGRIATFYTGFIKDPSQPASKGEMFHTSGEKEFIVDLGKGLLIQGWEKALLQMSVGERSTLHISSDYAYGTKFVAQYMEEDGSQPC